MKFEKSSGGNYFLSKERQKGNIFLVKYLNTKWGFIFWNFKVPSELIGKKVRVKLEIVE